MRTPSFTVVIATVTVAHADPLEDHLQALRGYGVSGLHDATALIVEKRSITVRECDDYTGLSSFAPKYDPADWGTDPTAAAEAGQQARASRQVPSCNPQR